MRSMLALLLALLFVPLVAGQPGIDDAITDGVPFELDHPDTVARMEGFLESVSGQAVHDCVAQITRDVPFSYRLMGTPTQDAFVDKYQNVFSDLGLASTLQPFPRGSGAFVGGTVLGEGGTNILAVLPGRDVEKWVVIGGHFDTREGTIGALDNTSGICTVKEIARAMKADTDANGPYEASVIFNWYDGEEWGLYGAIGFSEDFSYANELLGRAPDAPVDVLVSQSFDMPGINYPAYNIWPRYPEGEDPSLNTEKPAVLNLRTAPIHAVDENGENIEWTCWSYGCYEELKTKVHFNQTLVNFTNYQFLVREVAYDLMGTPPNLVWVYDDFYGRSDHIPLIGMGAAGMRIQGSHDQEYPCYHQPCDTLEWLYLQTGDETGGLLVDAYDIEADAGGTTAMYVALMGHHSKYGEHLFLKDMPAQAMPNDVVDVEKDTPLGAVVALLAMIVAFAIRRR